MASNSHIDFDPEDQDSWYFGKLSRDETNNILQNERENGTFLVRDSKTIAGDFVLCVKEDSKISHYIINVINSGNETTVKIGDNSFPDLPNLLKFYKTHYLDTTPLIRPAAREKLIAKYEFPGNDPEDLPFKKGDILIVITKDEEQWWTARNLDGSAKGLIPVVYTKPYNPLEDASSPGPTGTNQPKEEMIPTSPAPQQQQQQQPQSDYRQGNLASVPVINGKRELPCYAKVIKAKYPSPYDERQLKLEIGDKVKVLQINKNGEWEGEIDGKKGFFPFTHVKFIDSPDKEGDDTL